MAVMAVVFAWQHYAADLLPMNPWAGVFYPGHGAPWTVVTAVFLHADWFHLIGNLLYFQVFARPLEARTGPWLFGAYFLILGVAGNLTHGLVSSLGLMGSAGTGVMGASGALAGLIAFSLIRFYNARIQVAWWVFAPLMGQNRAGRTYVSLAAAVAVWLLLQLAQTLVAGETGSNISFGAHLGGFAIGLVLALTMGQLREGRIETRRMRAMTYFNEGHYYAAVGSWLEYLEMVPEDLEGVTGLARSRQMVGQTDQASGGYRKVFKAWLDRGRVDLALQIHDEACRSTGAAAFTPRELAQVAYYREKSLDYQGAADAYQRLYEAYPDHSEGQRALVRLVVLYHGKLSDPRSGDWWLERALTALPAGTWRDYLEKDFTGAAGPGEEATAEPAGTPSAG